MLGKRMTVLSALAIILCGPSVSASSLVPRDVDSQTLANFAFFSQFATAAYCSNNNDKGTNNVLITCPGANNCGSITVDGVKTVLQFTGDTGPNVLTNINGFVAIDDKKKLIVVAFRGTHGFRNIVTDLRIGLADAGELCSGCKANDGFWTGYKNVRMRILNSVVAVFKRNPSYQIVVTGHSLGGAIATYAAADLRNNAQDNKFGPIDLYTYGAPRSTNREFASFISNTQAPRLGRNFRITHKRDPVPRVPAYRWGYDHVYPQYFISQGNGVAVTQKDISMSYGCCDQGDDLWAFKEVIQDKEGPSGLDIDAHLWYFTNISTCGGRSIEPQGVTPADVEPLVNGTQP